MNIAQTLQQAITGHQAGETQEAERLYRFILAKEPKHPDANHCMSSKHFGLLAAWFKRQISSLGCVVYRNVIAYA